MNVRHFQFLRLRKCMMRESADYIDDNVHASWANDELLHLDGVLKLSFRELKAQLQVTAIILDSISVETARRVRRDSVHADPSLTDDRDLQDHLNVCKSFEYQLEEPKALDFVTIGDDSDATLSSAKGITGLTAYSSANMRMM